MRPSECFKGSSRWEEKLEWPAAPDSFVRRCHLCYQSGSGRILDTNLEIFSTEKLSGAGRFWAPLAFLSEVAVTTSQG